MRLREKHEGTYNSALKEERRLEKKLADIIVDNSRNFKALELNTVQVHQDVGKLLVLRDIIWR